MALGTIYNIIATELLSASANAYFESKNLPRIKHVALFNNQYRYEKTESAYNLPAVFIEFANTVYSQNQQNVRSAEKRVRLHVEISNWYEYSERSADKAKAVKILDFYETVDEIIQEIGSDKISKFKTIADQVDADHGNAPVHIWEYAVAYHDDTVSKYRNFQKVQNFDVAIGKTLKTTLHTSNNDASGYLP